MRQWVFYGAIGVFRLDVLLDYGPLAGATLLAGVVARSSMMSRSVTGSEQQVTR